MANVLRVGVDQAGGGPIIAADQRTVMVNGAPIACALDEITPHGSDAHAAPTITSGAMTVLANGFPVATTLSIASCGDPLGPGATNVMINTP